MSTFEQHYQKLNTQQKKAVDTIEGPVMVVAGPGTGKTQILALRIANILKSTDTNPNSILCLTFTESGVKAMRERLIRFIKTDAYKVNIHTFHSFSNELIQTFPDKFSFAKDLRQIDDLTRIKIVRSLIDGFINDGLELKHLIPFYDKYSKVGTIINDIQGLKKEGINPNELKARNEAFKNLNSKNAKMQKKETVKMKKELEIFERVDEFIEFYQHYQDKLLADGLYDYEDMINFVIDKFKNDEDFLRDIQERFLYILVDEFQDTNGSQNEILQLLGNFDSAPNIFVVGDDDQAIYRFQGANIENIMSFREHFSDVVIIPTTVNYRSSRHIIEIAENIITNNESRLVKKYKDIEKKLSSGIKENIEVKSEIREFASADEENIFIAKEIKKLHEEKGISFDEIAILYRKNKHAEDINDVLHKFDVPTKLDTSKAIFDIDVINKLINLLKVISFFDKKKNELLYDVMLYDFLGLETIDVYRLINFASKKRIDLFDLLLELTEFDKDSDKIDLFTNNGIASLDVSNLKLKSFEKIEGFVDNLIEWHNLSANISFPKFVERVINESGLLEFISNKDSKASFEDVLAINAFFDFIKQQYEINKAVNLSLFLSDLNVIRENYIKISLPKSSLKGAAVNLLTAHGSKGLEFKYVFIIKATESNWGKTYKAPTIVPPNYLIALPHTNEGAGRDLHLTEKDLLLEDERRLFFVAITRAKEKIYFTYAKEYLIDGVTKVSNIAPFITEIKEESLERKANAEFILELADLATILKPAENESNSIGEEEFLIEQIQNFKLTPSSLNEYIKSPLEFKKNQLIKVPRAPNKSLALGTAIHYALEQLHKEFKMHNAFSSLESILKYYSQKLYIEFFGDEEYDRTLKEGTTILTEYYNYYVKESQMNEAAETEYGFYYHNIYFDPKDGSEPIPLSGRLDKVEYLTHGNEGAGRDPHLTKMGEVIPVRLVDYKTSSPKSENEIRGLTKNSDKSNWRQLVFYKLLADLDPKFRPGRNFNMPKYDVQEVEIDFIKPDKKKFIKRSFKITNEDVEELKKLVVEVMKRIRNLEFPEKSGLEK